MEKQQPRRVEDASLRVPTLRPGAYQVRWWDTREGNVIAEERAAAAEGGLRLGVPPFTEDIACQIQPATP